MKYSEFDEMGNEKSRNKIISVLRSEALTFDELSVKVKLNRTSVFYHISILEKEGRIIKRFVGKVAYVGLIKGQRKLT